MRKIILLCAQGMSTSVIVKKMKEAAAAENYECEIAAYGISEIESVTKDADIVLTGPQIKFRLKEVQTKCPDKIVEPIDMKDYGMLNGKAIVDKVKKLLGD